MPGNWRLHRVLFPSVIGQSIRHFLPHIPELFPNPLMAIFRSSRKAPLYAWKSASLTRPVPFRYWTIHSTFPPSQSRTFRNPLMAIFRPSREGPCN
ncbi:hypothetical protein CEXT_542781 [Caerostris extrusa]|uniref:Uncharacterized protein n=1 Tax=Caerostris extrusa TaxID=172846 RepID=A0AAV4YCL8_CAEEX|nr:hypothetical protein CEXT_542781 [Caerostris extrusa]